MIGQGPFGFGTTWLRAPDSSTGIKIRVNKKAKITTKISTNIPAPEAAIFIDRNILQHIYTTQNRLDRVAKPDIDGLHAYRSGRQILELRKARRLFC